MQAYLHNLFRKFVFEWFLLISASSSSERQRTQEKKEEKKTFRMEGCFLKSKLTVIGLDW